MRGQPKRPGQPWTLKAAGFLLFFATLAVAVYAGTSTTTEVFRLHGATLSVDALEVGRLEEEVFGVDNKTNCPFMQYEQGTLSDACQGLFAELPPFNPELTDAEQVCTWNESNSRLDLYTVLDESVARLGKNLDIEDVAEAVTCPPVEIGRVQLYDTHQVTRQGFHQREVIHDIVPGEFWTFYRVVGDTLFGPHLVVTSSNARFDWGETVVYPGNVITDTQWTAPFSNSYRPLFPPSTRSSSTSAINVGDPRWSEAAIALGRSGASGCGEFTLSAGGIARCVDSGESWRIRNGQATLD